MWNETIQTALETAISGIIIAVGSFLCVFIRAQIKDLQEKIKNDKLNKYITRATELVASCIDTVSQTYVDALKKEGTFTQKEQKEAFNKCVDQVKNLMTVETQEAITEAYGDITKWIGVTIEAQIQNKKNSVF